MSGRRSESVDGFVERVSMNERDEGGRYGYQTYLPFLVTPSLIVPTANQKRLYFLLLQEVLKAIVVNPGHVQIFRGVDMRPEPVVLDAV